MTSRFLFFATLTTSLLVCVSCEKDLPQHHQIKPQIVSDFTDVVSSTARLRSEEQSFLSVKSGGTLDEVYIKNGDTVTKNQILAVIDKELRTANLQKALSNFKLAKTEYRRIKRLHRNGSSTQSELDKAQASLDVKQSELKIMREELKDAVIRSPLDGIVDFFAFKKGDIIPDGSRLAVIENPKKLEARVKIAFDKTGIVVGEREITVSPYNLGKRKISGDAIAVKANISRLNADSDYDSAYGEIAVKFNSQKDLKPGDLVHFELYRKEYEQVYSLPSGVFFIKNSKPYYIGVSQKDEVVVRQARILNQRSGRVFIEKSDVYEYFISPREGQSWQGILQDQRIAQQLNKGEKDVF